MRHGYHADPIRDGGCQRHHHPREPAPMRLDIITAHLNGAAQASSDDEDTGRFCGSKTWHHLRGEQRRGGRRRACCRRAAAHTKKRTRQECGNVRTEIEGYRLEAAVIRELPRRYITAFLSMRKAGTFHTIHYVCLEPQRPARRTGMRRTLDGRYYYNHYSHCVVCVVVRASLSGRTLHTPVPLSQCFLSVRFRRS